MKDYLNKNLSYIQNNKIVKNIKESNLPEWLEIKDNNLLIKKRNRVVAAYPDNIKDEMAQINKQKIFYSDSCTVLIGAGLGYLVEAIFKSADFDHKIILIDPIIGLIKETLKKNDFSKYIKKNQLFFVFSKDEVVQAVAEIEGIFVIQNWLIFTEKYTLHLEEYSEIIPHVIEVINQERCNVGTVAGAGSIIAENDIKNLPFCIRHRGINELKNFYKGKPAILIATGPSIQNNIHLLRKIQNKAIIITVAQALRMLLAYDIKPDFITTVDYGEVNYEHFKGLMDINLPLVCLNRTYAKILKEWEGPKFVTTSPQPGSENSAIGYLYKKGALESGGSVVHLSFQLAKHLGCNPIIFLGHSFSFGKGLSHTLQVDAGGKIETENGVVKWKILDPKSSLKGKDYTQGNSVYLPGILGEDVLTNVGLMSFVTSMERMIKVHEGTVINASEDGVAIKGCRNLTLKKVIENYLQENINKSKIKKLYSLSDNWENDIKNIIELLKKDIKILNKIIDNSKKGEKAAKELLKKYLTKEEYYYNIKENEKYAKKAHFYAKQNALIGLAIYAESRLIHNRRYKLNLNKNYKNSLERKKDVNKKFWNDFNEREKGAEKSILILEAAKKAAKKLKIMYKDVLNLFEKYLITKDENLFVSKENYKVDINSFDKYLDVGNWTHPYIDLKKISVHQIINENVWDYYKRIKKVKKEELEKSEKNYDKIADEKQKLLDFLFYIKEAHKLGREKKDFYGAIDKLEKAVKLMPKRIEGRWGLASANFYVGNIEKAKKLFEKLCSDFGDRNPRMFFEYGVILLNYDIQEGIKYIKKAMDFNNEFDYFFKELGNLYGQMGNYKMAKDAYLKYKESYPDDYTVDCYLDK